MLVSAQDMFAEAVRILSPAERLRLASLILNDLTEAELSAVDISDVWSEQDQGDLTVFSLQYAATLYEEDEGLV